MAEDRTEQARNASTSAGLPRTSLIICSRNRPKLLAEAVESILLGDDLPTELIIVDQSDMPNPDLANLTPDSSCELRYLWTKSVGLSRANNYGTAAARYDLFVFTHDDILVSPTWFGLLVRSLIRAGPRTVVTGRVLQTTAEAPGHFAPSTKADEVSAVYEGRIGADVLFPMSMAMYRSAIEEIGKFDERLGPGTPFPAAEDNDLGFRLLDAGYRIVYVPEAILYHRAWRTEQDYVSLRWCYGRGQGAYYAKHLSLRDPYMLGRMVRHLKAHALGFARQVSRQRRLAYGHVAYILGLLSGAAQWILTQRRTP